MNTIFALSETETIIIVVLTIAALICLVVVLSFEQVFG